MVHAVARTEDREGGAVAIIVAIFAVVLFGFAALVVDIGHAQTVRGTAQDAVDAGALAGAQELSTYLGTSGNMLPDPDLQQIVEAAVEANIAVSAAEWQSCAPPPSGGPYVAVSASNTCVQWAAADTSEPTRVRVEFPRRHVPSTFGGIFGVGSVTVAPVAVAAFGSALSSPLCEPCDPPLGGAPSFEPLDEPLPAPTPTLTATPPPPSAAPASSPPPSGTPPSSPPPSGTPPSSAQPSGTPLSSAPQPSASPPNGCPVGPGLYTKDIDVGSCNLAPGLYVFDDSTLRITGSLIGDDVTLWFSGSGTLDIEGSLLLRATDAAGPSMAGELPGFAVVFAAGDSATFELGASFQIGGTLYASEATWRTDAGDCPDVTPPVCKLQPGVLAVTSTHFVGSEPRVAGEVPAQPPEPPHLVE